MFIYGKPQSLHLLLLNGTKFWLLLFFEMLFSFVSAKNEDKSRKNKWKENQIRIRIKRIVDGRLCSIFGMLVIGSLQPLQQKFKSFVTFQSHWTLGIQIFTFQVSISRLLLNIEHFSISYIQIPRIRPWAPGTRNKAHIIFFF